MPLSPPATPVRTAPLPGSTDSKAWARTIIARHQAGQTVNHARLTMAKAALGMIE